MAEPEGADAAPCPPPPPGRGRQQQQEQGVGVGESPGGVPDTLAVAGRLYEQWRRNPKVVHDAWDAFFSKLASLYDHDHKESEKEPKQESETKSETKTEKCPGVESAVSDVIEQHLLLQHVIRSYQVRGHLVADVDPLGVAAAEAEGAAAGSGGRRRRGRGGMPPERVLGHLAAQNLADLEQPFRLSDATAIARPHERTLSLREIVRRLHDAYCTHIGVEYMYITSHEKLQWIRRRFEPPGCRHLSDEVRRSTVFRLARATAFEAFLAQHWSSERRFGIEGCEALIPAVEFLIDRAAQAGVEMVVVGAPHRGRLNLLANVCRKPIRQLLLHFHAVEPTATGTGDLKYHLGTLVRRRGAEGARGVDVCVLATPSHLEAADPVVQGRTRAEQFLRGDTAGDKVMSIMLHGDAAFCGQGVVYETFHLSHLPSYTTHGSVHIVINNQVGYTTDPRFSRSSPYCTDVARVVNAPIFHVNADHPDAVMHCCAAALDYRMRFHADVVIDLVGYRRNGHNEADEPMFTQPLMYKIIRQHPPVLDLYTRQLVADGVVTAEEVEGVTRDFLRLCAEEHEASQRESAFSWSDWLDSPWKGFFTAESRLCESPPPPTGLPLPLLRLLLDRALAPPPPALRFDVHPGVEALLRARRQLAAQAGRVDWATAEALAFASLLREGVHVRLSGQDVERGVFGQRHHVLHHQSRDKERYVPLQHLFPAGEQEQAAYEVCNSSLSEFAVLGFEAGYAMASPRWLVLWEAQFGDFTNTAQCVIDQFLASGESKWTRQCGLVLLCPHGMEGMGPEHSCAHVSRFLQLCADDPDAMPEALDARSPLRQLRDTNWVLATPSTPANLFHALRRQVALPFRKPLVLFTPKGGLLRSPHLVSPLEHMLTGTEFQRVIPDDGPASEQPGRVRRHIMCSGKIYYEFAAGRRERGLEAAIALTRLEQLCPFPYDALLTEVRRYPSAELCWAQEEHKNHGPWNYILQRFGTMLSDSQRDSVTYIGRDASPAAATGSRAVHLREQLELLEEALTLEAAVATPTPGPEASRSRIRSQRSLVFAAREDNST